MPVKARTRKSKPKSASTLDAELDAALRGTFPASDPVSVGGATSTERPAHPVDRQAPVIDLDEVAELGRRRKGVSAS